MVDSTGGGRAVSDQKTGLIKGTTMKSSMKDKIEGTFHEAKGKVKEMAGEIADNPEWEAEGKAEKIAGKTQKKIGQRKKVLGN